MSTDIQIEQPMNQLSEAAREAALRASEGAKEISKKAASTINGLGPIVEGIAGDIIDATKNAAKCTGDSAVEIYRSAALKVEDSLETSREYVRRNPFPVVIGAIAFGAAIGSMLMVARRKPTFSERYEDRPLVAMREAILSALTPAAQRVHEGLDSARNGAGKVIDQVQSLASGRSGHSLSRRIGSNLKFW